METLTLGVLKEAVAGKYAAVRRVTRLEPVGEKVFPPTYEGGDYAEEQRQLCGDGGKVQTIETVLLDSVQSQANRMELALQRAYDAGDLKMPMLQIDFAGSDDILKEVGRITALDAPHRMCDAIFRDSVYPGTTTTFRGAEPGSKLNSANAANATAVFELCPTALVFGFWDSTGPRGGLGAKVQRALVSEIVGYQSVAGKRTSSRIDPLQIENNVDIYAKQGGGWTFAEDNAEKKNGQPIKLKPSEINHGNIMPSFRDKNGDLNHGGVTLAYAEQHTVLSLAALRRLRFPLPEKITPEVDNAARTVLAALGLCAICFLDEDGFDLRSRCLLDGKPGVLQFVGGGTKKDFTLIADSAAKLLDEAAKEATALDLPWRTEPVKLHPSPDLGRLVVESRRRSMTASAGE